MPKSDDSTRDDGDFRRELRSRTRRGFAGAAAGIFAGAAGWAWFLNSPREGFINRAMRRSLELHERVGRATFRDSSRAPVYDAGSGRIPIVNGSKGLFSPLDAETWRMVAVGARGEAVPEVFTLSEILSLPRFDLTTELRCVEGWTTIVRWSGVRLRDFAASTGLASRTGRPGYPLSRRGDTFAYVGLATPDEGYRVGLDIESALHPQTLLCDRMNGLPLPPEHGGPLRLVIPVKYGYKSLKRIGTIRFTDRRPPDTWAEMGYDWYAGL